MLALPALVLLESIGLDSPYPWEDNLKASIPWLVKYSFTAFALESDNLWLSVSLPTLSVCPSTVNLAVGYSLSIPIISANTALDCCLIVDLPVSNKIVLA